MQTGESQKKGPINHEHWIRLYLTRDIGLATFFKLLTIFESPTAVLNASSKTLDQLSFLTKGQRDNIVRAAESPEISKTLQYVNDNGIGIVTLADSDYPERLKHIHLPPPVLFVTGDLQPWDCNAIALVGTRNASAYGISSAAFLSRELAERGLTIVSGLARGIDQTSHEAAVAIGGRTIAIIGSGHGKLYPRENEKLAARITQNGAVISEFAPLTPPNRGNFPRRNRIISGLSLGVLVVEAPQKSGALITARYALEQNREVFAVPGRINTSKSAGCNQLIQAGARCVCDADDILLDIENLLDKRYLITKSDVRKNKNTLLSTEQKKLFDIIGEEPIHIDILGRTTGFHSGEIATYLLQLEMFGLIRELPGKFYTRVY